MHTKFAHLKHRVAMNVLFAIVIAALIPVCLSHAILNFARLKQLNGTLDANIYGQATKLNPYNQHVRLLAGNAFAQSDNYVDAIKTLFPLSLGESISPDVANILLPLLATQSRWADILPLSEKSPSDHWTVSTASTVILASVNMNQLNIPTSILANALGLSVSDPEMELLVPLIHSPDFWRSNIGLHLLKILTLRASLHYDYPPSKVSLSKEQLNPWSNVDLNFEQAIVGNNLIYAGDFATQGTCAKISSSPWCLFPGWSPSLMTTGNPWNRALFVISADDQIIKNNRMARIDGLLIENDPNKEPARAGIRSSPILLKPVSIYVISFTYKTDTLSSSLWINNDPAVISSKEHLLLPTQGKWARFTMIGWNHKQTAQTVSPILRLWSTGTVWFDDFSVREIRRTDGQPIPPRDPIIDIRPAE